MSGQDHETGGLTAAPAGAANPSAEPQAAPAGTAENPGPTEAGDQAAPPPRSNPYRDAARGSARRGGIDASDAYQKGEIVKTCGS